MVVKWFLTTLRELTLKALIYESGYEARCQGQTVLFSYCSKKMFLED